MKKILGLTLISVTLLAGCSKLLPHRSSDKSKASDPSTSQTTTNQAKEEKTKVLKGKWDEFDVTMTFVYTDVVKHFKMDMLGKMNVEIPAGVTPEEFQAIFREAMEDSPEYLEIKDEPGVNVEYFITEDKKMRVVMELDLEKADLDKVKNTYFFKSLADGIEDFKKPNALFAALKLQGFKEESKRGRENPDLFLICRECYFHGD